MQRIVETLSVLVTGHIHYSGAMLTAIRFKVKPKRNSNDQTYFEVDNFN